MFLISPLFRLPQAPQCPSCFRLKPLPRSFSPTFLLLLPHTYINTGLVLAVRGRAEPGGDFVVSDVLWPGLCPQPERPLMDTDKYVALVSGLQLADRKSDMMQVCWIVWGVVCAVWLCCANWQQQLRRKGQGPSNTPCCSHVTSAVAGATPTHCQLTANMHVRTALPAG